jgi:ankyrin repeat protein
MEEIILRFPHLAEKIFQKLTNEGLARSREVERLWQKFIDEKNYPWLRIVNIPTILQDGNSYMHLAAQYGQMDIFEMILSGEENKNPKNLNGETPFIVACTKGRMNIAIILLNKSNELAIDLNMEDNYGRTGFHQACLKGHSEVTEIIVKNAASNNIDLNSKDNFGRTAFSNACSMGHLEVAEMIMKNAAKIDLNLKDNYGRTAFHHACLMGHSEIAEIIMKNAAKIDLNMKDEDGDTAFHLACWRACWPVDSRTEELGKIKIVDMMIEQSVSLELDLKAKNNDDKTGYQLAKEEGATDIVNLIQTKMRNLVV